MERTVRLSGEDISVRSFKIKDDTASCKVSLWKDLSKRKTAVGSHFEITDVIVQVYNDEKSVSTTSRTKLLPITAPDVKKRVAFVVFEVEDNGFFSLTGDLDDGDYPEFLIKTSLLAKALQCQPKEVEVRLLSKLPLKAEIIIKEKEVKVIQIQPQ
ncbi:uncharacterized protein LOC133179942 [Saccostrea echinata]|uniref:uncharacterized protein LOC133179942 n=1 Tax=Saccostrea echinata TaxID=191078 RepID=UPI002A80F1CE|nr:uncharacterized protein LOC133179942 [Saccostrea echinata]